MTRRTKAKDLRRPRESRSELRTIVVMTEGVTEYEYVDALRRLSDVADVTTLQIDIDPTHGEAPWTLVNRAVRVIRDPEVNECWCLFDVEWPDHHPRLNEAVQLARKHEIEYAISNPCFEVWLLLHSTPLPKFLTTAEAQRKARAGGRYHDKHIDATAYMPDRHAASKAASDLAKWHDKHGTVMPDDNPSSGMFRLLQAVGATPRS